MKKLKSPILFFLLLASACHPSICVAGDSCASDNVKNIITRYEGVWAAPPKRVPSNFVTDAPMLGNGDIGVMVGGFPEKQQFFISKCDFWRPMPYYPWFTPSLVGTLDLEIPALKGATYKTVQDIAKAEVRQTFTKPDIAVELRSWTPATGNELIVEVSCTGKPVVIKASPWTYFGNGATVENGQDGEVSWLTRSFTGPEFDWDSIATLAVSMEGSTAGMHPTTVPAAPPMPVKKFPVVLGGRQLFDKAAQRYSRPFQGKIHALDIFDRTLTADEISKLQKGEAIETKPVFSTRKSNPGGLEVTNHKTNGISMGEITLAPNAFTIFLDVTPAGAGGSCGHILEIGEQGKGILIFQRYRGVGYSLQARAGTRGRARRCS